MTHGEFQEISRDAVVWSNRRTPGVTYKDHEKISVTLVEVQAEDRAKQLPKTNLENVTAT